LRMIEYFRANPDVSRKTDEIELHGRRYFATFTPKRLKPECLRCHGDPKDAPAALVKRYGSTASFHRPLGDVAGLDTVAVPVDVVNTAMAAEMRWNSVVLVSGLALLFGSVIIMFRLVVTRRLAAMARHFQEIAAHPESPRMTPIRVTGNDEIAVVGAAFNKLVEQLRSTHALLEQRVSRRTAELSQANQSLRESEEKYRRIVDTANEGVWALDEQDRTTFVNARMAGMLGYETEEMIGRRYDSFLLEEDVADHAVRAEVLRQGEAVQHERRLRCKDGRTVWTIVSASPLLDGENRFCGSFAMFTDITLRKRAEEELRTAARVDKLTGLINRSLLRDRLDRAFLRSKRLPDYRFAVLYIDLDGFKLINDSLGHQLGDLLLIEAAQRLRDEVRALDTVSRDMRGNTAARLGGDEFIILLDGIAGADDAKVAASRLLAILSRPYVLQGHEVICAASIGIVTSEMGVDRAEDLLRDADTALYEAKQAGRNRYAVFDTSMRARIQARLAVEIDLRKALGAGQLLLYYQPIVSLNTGALECYEALLRWKHPERGIILPAEFVSVAEDSGIILPIGEWVLREACRQFSEWRKAGGSRCPPPISVNLSRNQLLHSGLPKHFRAIVQEAGVDPGSIHLEITESAVMRDPQEAAEVLRELKEIGFRIDLDDFGTGCSSLACLHQFPIDVVKIDRSFIANMEKGEDFVQFVKGIIMLARSFRIAVVAEGVETQGQLALLQSLGCQYAQGYLFAKAMPAAEAIVFRTPEALAVSFAGDPLGAMRT
jgi:diguanylate cyclase (GGDEF)-like protein/PAS domain S-box-containing protein